MHDSKYGGGWWPLPEFEEGFTIFPPDTPINNLNLYQMKPYDFQNGDGKPMFKRKCPKTGAVTKW